MQDHSFAPGLAAQLAEAWDTRPQVFRDALLSPAFTPREYMDGVIGTARDYVADPNNRYGRVFVAGDVVTPEQLPPFLPASASQPLSDYLAALTSVHPDFAVVLNGCERYIPSVRARFIPLLHGLFSRVGYPAQTSLGCVYSGTYTTSPFGIHTDPCHVLMCCGIGRKTMAFWPRSYFEPMHALLHENKVQVRVADHLQHATLLEIGPSDLLYWPANTWHVGVSETRDFHASLSLGLYHRASNPGMFLALDFMPRRPSSTLPEVEQYASLDLRGLGPSLTSQGMVTTDQLHASHLAEFFEVWHRVRDALNAADEAEYRVLTLVLSCLSSAGFGKPRAASGAVAASLAGMRLHCPVPEALVGARVRGGLLVGANGHLFFYTQHVAAVERLIADLRQAPSTYEACLASSGAANGAIADVIRDFVSAEAVSSLS